jgi:8'-apo-carotenoid 13,14-cleaving dioxygenase
MAKTHLSLPGESTGISDPAATERGDAPVNGYLEGPFAPVRQEMTIHDLRVTGTIPRELNGRFLRVGSNANPFDPENPRTYNWFIGSGMIFGVRLRDGKALWYRNRFVRDDKITKSLGLPRLPGPEVISRREPYKERKGPRFVEANVSQTHVFAVNGRTYSFAEGGVLPIEVSYELESVARCDFDGTLGGSWTAHPHRDPRTGALHGVAYFWQWDHALYQVLGADGTVSERVEVPLTGRPVIHDCAITPTWAIFLDGPVQFNEAAHAAGFEFPYLWDQDYPVRFGLVRRDGSGSGGAGGRISYADAPGACVFHTLNAFDLPDGKVALDACNAPVLFKNDLSGPTDSKSHLARFIIDPRKGTATREVLSDRPQEMPRHDERLTGYQHRYAYMNSRMGNSGILKHDLATGTSEFFDHGPGRVGIETLFVPMSPDSAEDDGWLITSVIDMPTDSSEVLIYHAQDLLGGPVARIHIPHRHNAGFHGNWIPDSEIGNATGPL